MIQWKSNPNLTPGILAFPALALWEERLLGGRFQSPEPGWEAASCQPASPATGQSRNSEERGWRGHLGLGTGPVADKALALPFTASLILQTTYHPTGTVLLSPLHTAETQIRESGSGSRDQDVGAPRPGSWSVSPHCDVSSHPPLGVMTTHQSLHQMGGLLTGQLLGLPPGFMASNGGTCNNLGKGC